MAQTTVVNLIPNTNHTGSEGTAITIIGDAEQAADYYVALRNSQTISWNLSSSFEGDIDIEATLDTDVDNNTLWTRAYAIDTSNYNGYYNLVGNYVWIRARVHNWTKGTIVLVSASY